MANDEFKIENGELVAYTGEGGDIVIPSGVTKINDEVFKEKDGITSVVISEGVKEIGGKAFYSCTNLKSVKLPNTLETIMNCAFDSCSNLTSVIIPKSVTKIDYAPFIRCENLKEIKVETGNQNYYIENDCLIESETKKLIQGFNTSIIPSDIKEIGDLSFSNCSGLKHIEIPQSVTKIGEAAFDTCSGLTSVTIPKSVTKIDYNPFIRCENLKEIKVEIGNQNYYTENDCLIESETKKLIQGLTKFSNTSVKVPDGVTEICNQVFFNSNIEKIYIPDSVISIGDYSFCGCENLQNIRLSENLKSIGEASFFSCKKLTEIKLPESLNEIGNCAFSCCEFEKITLPSGLTEIAPGLFSVCTELKEITLPPNIQKIGDGAFISSGLEHIEIPNTVKEIGDNVFMQCVSLKSVTIPDSVEKIGKGIFMYCMSLDEENVKLPDHLNLTRAYLFDGEDDDEQEDSNENNSDEDDSEDETEERDYSEILKYNDEECNYAEDKEFFSGENLFFDEIMMRRVKPSSAERKKEFVIDGNILVAYNGMNKNVVVPDGVERILRGAFFDNLESIVLPSSVKIIDKRAIINKKIVQCENSAVVASGNSAKMKIFAPHLSLEYIREQLLVFFDNFIMGFVSHFKEIEDTVDKEIKNEYLSYIEELKYNFYWTFNDDFCYIMTKYNLLKIEDVDYLLGLSEKKNLTNCVEMLKEYKKTCRSSYKDDNNKKDLKNNDLKIEDIPNRKIMIYDEILSEFAREKNLSKEKYIYLHSLLEKQDDSVINLLDKYLKLRKKDDDLFSFYFNELEMLNIVEEMGEDALDDEIINDFFGNCLSNDDALIPYGTIKIIEDAEENEEEGIISSVSCGDLISIPNTVKELGSCSLSSNYSIESVVIPDGVTKIGSLAFLHDTNLKKVIIPASVTEIEDDAFYIAFDECYSGVYLDEEFVPFSLAYFDNQAIWSDIYEAIEGVTNLTIYCPKGSYAEKYAEEHGINCKNI